MTHPKATSLYEFSRLSARERRLAIGEVAYQARLKEFGCFGCLLTPEEREWQRTKLLPAVLGVLQDATAEYATAGKSGQ